MGENPSKKELQVATRTSKNSSFYPPTSKKDELPPKPPQLLELCFGLKIVSLLNEMDVGLNAKYVTYQEQAHEGY